MLNLANFTGRVGWGFASDKMGRKTFYLLSAGVQALAVGFMALSIPSSNFGGWLASFLIIGSLYGGGFGVIPATVGDGTIWKSLNSNICAPPIVPEPYPPRIQVSDIFGPHISAATHGVMISVWSAAAVIGIPCFSSITASFYHTSPTGSKIPNPEAYARNAW